MAFKKDNKVKSNFSKITIGLASPEEILENSWGEVLKPETINYRTYKPERDGLFCERIFGPCKDYECHCGKYKRIRYKGIVCDRCGVEVTEKKVRRERMGHIELVVPVAHIWYFRSLPNKIGYLLGIPTKQLDAIIYYERYIVLNAGAAASIVRPGQIANGENAEKVQRMDLLSEEEYLQILDQLPEGNEYLSDDDPEKFVAKMGAEAIYDLLLTIDLDKLSYELRDRANNDGSQQRKTEALKRLQVVESFRASRDRNKPEWMILKNVPVTPPELRPLVPLDGGRFATTDINDLYRRVIIRNNRLKRLIEIKAPEVILRNEKRMLQEAVDSLLDNSRKSSAVKSEANRPLKSLSDSLKGKQGRFRQNLLGKRVDYSARSVIVVGPELKMGECGLPKLMAAELYKPFIIRKLIERGIVKTVKSAKKIVDRKDPVIWDILEFVMKGHPVLLNRAPTLHRLGIQAFQPKLIEGKAIQLHPLACTAFNADFDGDQMAVHLPLSNEAILEAQLLMLQSHNILNPANGAPITVPAQDMVLGLYYITKMREGAKGQGLIFYGPEEALIAYNEGKIDVHAPIKVKVWDYDENGNRVKILRETSVGRVIVNELVPEEVGYINTIISKKSLRDIITEVIKKAGMARACDFLDGIKNLGYEMAFKGGLSFNLNDIIIPKEKEELVAKGNEEVEEIMNEYNMGFITDNERYNKVIDVWTHVNDDLSRILMKTISADNQGFNSVYMMLDSGARGSKEQIRQLSGMRGLMAKPQKAGAEGGQIIENPILSNFKEGLSVLEYFISTHGARKGLADTALKTADAGYLTRRLVDVSHDVIVNEEDCGTLRGLVCSALKNDDEVVASLAERILGRVSVHDINDPSTGELIVAQGEEITEPIAARIEAANIESVEIRSVLTCEAKKGVCAKCYGRNLATARMVEKGEAVGVIAAQSIGEPGTQLTLRTFHAGGTASNIAANASIVAKAACR
ncbi:MAG: DNA-directed RNA polymerase subunit beta', partial [Bacteroidaceae bacterium]|nr:DNA-directed RNA polymerase subunit beta' [Bacteroidaceae bacterium]